MSFTPALYIACSCDERDNKTKTMSRARPAEGYDTPALQGEDSPSIMVLHKL